jgi:hypothetical protein
MNRWIGLIVVVGLCVGLSGCEDDTITVQANEKVEQKTLNPDNELEQVSELIRNKNYQDAIRVLQNSPNYNSNQDYQVIQHYVAALLNDDGNVTYDGHSTILSLADIPDDYSGYMSDEIHAYMDKYSDLIKERKQYVNNVNEIKKEIAETKTNLSPLSPQIGMTADQVLETIWGKPKDINKTTTANGVNEQWVYGNGKYVYLEDGIVTAIQE